MVRMPYDLAESYRYDWSCTSKLETTGHDVQTTSSPNKCIVIEVEGCLWWSNSSIIIAISKKKNLNLIFFHYFVLVT
jgi:hypothetical protein